MHNFVYDIPTRVYFGEGQIENLPKELAVFGKKVLLAYGGGSIKKIGLYDKIMSLLNDNGFEVFEVSGIEPNPRIETVRKGAELCKSESIDMVLAIGGGSTIDCAKVIAAGACYDGDPWDLVINPPKITGALPIFDVLTLSATPIPRTLQFSLLGARDLSIINTPPPNRIPVQTEIMLFDKDEVKSIINYDNIF